MIPRIVYKTAYKDITNAYLQGDFTTEEWIEKWQAIIKDFEEEYGENAKLNLGE